MFNNEQVDSIFEDNNKENITNNNYIQSNINNEVEKLDDEQINQPFRDSSNNLLENNNFDFQNQIKNNKNINKNQNIINNKINSDKSNYTHEKINSGLNNEDNLHYNESYDFSGIDQDYLLLSSNGGKNIIINNIYLLLNSFSENQLYELYFPISYNKELDLNKLSSLLSIISNNGNELNEPISHIVVCLLKYIIENKININNINVLNNNEIKNKIIEILNNNIKNENKGIIS